MYELYQTNNSRGSIAEVWIDTEAKLCKKYFKVNGVTVRGTTPYFNSIEEITKMFDNEVYWADKLKSPYVLETYEHGELKDEPGFYLVQEYHGPDLMHYCYNKTLHESFPDIVDQMIEMFKFFKENNVHKINNSLTNIVGSNGRIKCFDFKYAVERTHTTKFDELSGIQKWLHSIDDKLASILYPYL